jgi:hypothetical protein
MRGWYQERSYSITISETGDSAVFWDDEDPFTFLATMTEVFE